METNKQEEILVGLDIGTTKICVLVTRKDENDKTEILGVGKAPSDGVLRGEVANIDKTVKSINIAVEQAEKQSGIKIRDVYVGIAGQHIQSKQHRGILARENAQHEISGDDVKNLVRDMHKLALEPGERIIHVLPQEFFVDRMPAQNDPVGMCGTRLEANFHVITGKVAAAQNIERCIEKAGLNMAGLILEPLASAASVLDEDEKEAGVALVDIGGGTTDLAIFEDGIIRHTCVIPFGGNIISEDIKTGCRIMKNQAEKLKVKYGMAVAIHAKENQIISIPGLKGRPPKEISMKNLANIIQSRMSEIFEQVYFEIKASGYANKLNGGVVITGGGSQLMHVKQLVEYITGLDARVGFPTEHLAKGFNEKLKHPMFATGLGLVEKAYADENRNTTANVPKVSENSSNSDGEIADFEPEVSEKDFVKAAKNPKVGSWWKDIIKNLPEWLMDEEDDFE